MLGRFQGDLGVNISNRLRRLPATWGGWYATVGDEIPTDGRKLGDNPRAQGEFNT